MELSSSGCEKQILHDVCDVCVMLSHDSFFSNVVTNELVTGHFSLTCASRRRLETDAIVVRGRKKTYCYLPEKDEWKRLADGLSHYTVNKIP